MSFTKTSSHGLAEISGRLGLASPLTSACDLITTPNRFNSYRSRVGLTLALTKDRRTLLKAGGGLFMTAFP